MPRANWGISAQDVDDFDRSSQFVPYDGPVPQNGMHHWVIKQLKYAARTKEKNAQLRAGLELVPRAAREDEHECAGFFIMAFLPITSKTQFRYVPLLDALGVTGAEFERRTQVDTDGNIQRIGSWRNMGDTMVAAQLRDGEDENGKPKKEIGTFAEITEEVEYLDDLDADDDEFDDEEYADEDE